MIKEAWTQEEIDTAKYMHLCYLEATKLLNPKSYNKNAQKPFDKLTKEQQFIDLFITRKMLNLVGDASKKVSSNPVLEELKSIRRILEDMNNKIGPKKNWWETDNTGPPPTSGY